MGAKLTVLIPTFNEAANLPGCLESLRGLGDELYVVDSFSTDRTVALAQAAGARVEQHEYVNSAAQKNWAIPRCSHQWVLIVDADERATPELRDEIRGLLDRPAGPEQDGYYIVRRTFFLGGELRHGGWERNDVQRFFKRDLGRYAERDVHADVAVSSGRSGRLKSKLEHHTCPPTPEGLNRMMQRLNRYTTQAAERYHREGRRPGLWNFTMHPAFEFFKTYVLRWGFLDGIPGFIACSLAAHTRFLRWVKLYARLRAGMPPPAAYDRGTTKAREIDGAADRRTPDAPPPPPDRGAAI